MGGVIVIIIIIIIITAVSWLISRSWCFIILTSPPPPPGQCPPQRQRQHRRCSATWLWSWCNLIIIIPHSKYEPLGRSDQSIQYRNVDYLLLLARNSFDMSIFQLHNELFKNIVYVWVFGSMEADVWTLNAGLCPAAELRCSPQMASSRVGNIFHLFSSFSVWRQFTLHCAAYLSTSLYSGELWSLGAGRWINQICRRLVHSSSTPMKGCLHPPLQSVLLSNCPFFSPCVYSSVHSSVAVSAVELQTNLREVLQIRRRPLLP